MKGYTNFGDRFRGNASAGPPAKPAEPAKVEENQDVDSAKVLLKFAKVTPLDSVSLQQPAEQESLAGLATLAAPQATPTTLAALATDDARNALENGPTTLAALAAHAGAPCEPESIKPLRCGDGTLVWRFPAGLVSDISPLPLMVRARNRGASLVRDGNTLIVSARQAQHPEVLHGLQRHAAAVLAQLSKESAERISRWQRGEPSDVIDVVGLEGPKEQ